MDRIMLRVLQGETANAQAQLDWLSGWARAGAAIRSATAIAPEDASLQLITKDTDNVQIVSLCVPYGATADAIDVFTPGCFGRSLSNPMLGVLVNFRTNSLLGRVGNGTARFYETGQGIWFEVEPPDTSWANDLLVSIDRGDITNNGVMWRALKSHADQHNGDRVRVIEEAELVCASVLSGPAAYWQ